MNFSPETYSLLNQLYSYILKNEAHLRNNNKLQMYYDINNTMTTIVNIEETKKMNKEIFDIIDTIHEVRYDDIFARETNF